MSDIPMDDDYDHMQLRDLANYDRRCKMLHDAFDTAYNARIAGARLEIAEDFDIRVEIPGSFWLVTRVREDGPGALIRMFDSPRLRESALKNICKDWLRRAADHEGLCLGNTIASRFTDGHTITWDQYARVVDMLQRGMTLLSPPREGLAQYAGSPYRNHTIQWATMWGLPRSVAQMIAPFLWHRFAPVDVDFITKDSLVTAIIGPFTTRVTIATIGADYDDIFERILWDTIRFLISHGYMPVFSNHNYITAVSAAKSWLRAIGLTLGTPDSPLSARRHIARFMS